MSTRFVDLGLLVVGIAVAVGAWSYGLWRHSGAPGDGLFPFIAGATLVVTIASGIVPTRASATRPATPTRPARLDVSWMRLGLLLVALGLYALILSTVGFPLSTAALLLLLAKIADERLSWRRAAVVTLLLSFGAYVVFTRALGVPLPAGIVGF